MIILLARKGRGFLPADTEADKVHAGLADGEVMIFKPVKVRSVPWHRMYFGICREIGQNQDPPRDENSIDYEVRIRAGHYDVMLIEDCEARIPKRIAFDRMTADEWAEYWKSAEVAIREQFGEEYLPGVAA